MSWLKQKIVFSYFILFTEHQVILKGCTPDKEEDGSMKIRSYDVRVRNDEPVKGNLLLMFLWTNFLSAMKYDNRLLTNKQQNIHYDLKI